ncbi:DUF4442 domain-containing protein [Deltaproteobacteria bacterium TL4]
MMDLQETLHDTAGFIRKQWAFAQKIPGGKLLFSKMVGAAAPYTGTISAEFIELREGYSKGLLRDRRKVRNHLNCIHAIAITNFGEVTTGLAMTYTMPQDARGIPIEIDVEYFKKARGNLICECSFIPFTGSEEKKVDIVGNIFNPAQELVAKVTVTWKIGPRRKKK